MDLVTVALGLRHGAITALQYADTYQQQLREFPVTEAGRLSDEVAAVREHLRRIKQITSRMKS